jgi:hypothetical protein
MRRAWVLLLSTGLFAAGLGCSRTVQHTGGVCDCDPPPVESVLHPYAGPGGLGPVQAAPVATATVLPKVVETPSR